MEKKREGVSSYIYIYIYRGCFTSRRCVSHDYDWLLTVPMHQALPFKWWVCMPMHKYYYLINLHACCQDENNENNIIRDIISN